jgi:O-antigen/teichoic acid export membrane protein
MASRKIGWPRAVPEFFRKASLSFMMRFGGLFIQFLGSVFIARILGASQYGAFTYASTWAVFVGTFLPLGMGDLSIRELPGYLARKQMAPLTGFLLTVLLTLLTTGLIATMTLFILEKTGVMVLEPGWFMVAFYAVIHAMVLSVSNGLNGFQRILTSQFLETILRQTIYLGLIGLAVLVGFSLNAVHVFELSLISAIPILIVMVVVLMRMLKTERAPRTKPEFYIKMWLAGALPLLMTAVANRLQLDLDVLMVGGILGHFDVGIYRAAARGAILVTIANTIALQLVGPMLSRALANEDHGEAQRLLSQAALVSLIAGVPIVLVFGLGANLYLGLFGPEFVQANTSLRLLLIGQSSIILAGADAILLIMLRRERLVLIVTTLGVALNFALNLALIGPFGIEGAAMASLVSMVIVRATLVRFILKTTGYDTTIFSALRSLTRR